MLCKRIVLSFGLFFVCAQSHAGDANLAFAAAQGGDFDTALTEWTPLAEQGAVKGVMAVMWVMAVMAGEEGRPDRVREPIEWLRLYSFGS